MLVKLRGALVYQNEISRKEHGPPGYGAAELFVGGPFSTISMNCMKFLVACFFSSHSEKDWGVEIKKAETCSGGGVQGEQ